MDEHPVRLLHQAHKGKVEFITNKQQWILDWFSFMKPFIQRIGSTVSKINIKSNDD